MLIPCLLFYILWPKPTFSFRNSLIWHVVVLETNWLCKYIIRSPWFILQYYKEKSGIMCGLPVMGRSYKLYFSWGFSCLFALLSLLSPSALIRFIPHQRQRAMYVLFISWCFINIQYHCTIRKLNEKQLVKWHYKTRIIIFLMAINAISIYIIRILNEVDLL